MDNKNTTSSFSARLLQLIDHLRWTQKKLALEMKISERTISRWMTEGITPRNRNILKICRATGCNPRFLSGDETTMFLVNSSDPLELEKYAEQQKERKILEQAVYVLGSKTDYSKLLDHNIKVFYRAVKAREADRRKGKRRKQDVGNDGENRRKGERRQKIAEGE